MREILLDNRDFFLVELGGSKRTILSAERYPITFLTINNLV